MKQRVLASARPLRACALRCRKLGGRRHIRPLGHYFTGSENHVGEAFRYETASAEVSRRGPATCRAIKTTSAVNGAARPHQPPGSICVRTVYRGGKGRRIA